MVASEEYGATAGGDGGTPAGGFEFFADITRTPVQSRRQPGIVQTTAVSRAEEYRDETHYTPDMCRDRLNEIAALQGVPPKHSRPPKVAHPPVVHVSGRFSRYLHHWTNMLNGMGGCLVQSGVYGGNSSAGGASSTVTASTSTSLRLYDSLLPSFVRENTDFARHMRFMDDPNDDSRRGAGFWFWKPLLIRHHLRHDAALPDRGWLVFSDVDRTDFLGWLAPMLEEMERLGHDMAVEQFTPVNYQEGMYTKGDVYDYFGVRNRFQPNERDRSPQYNANFLVFRKNEATLQFVSEWVESMKNYHLVSDEPSTSVPELPGYRNSHRHDQSMLSMILKYKYDDGSEKKAFKHKLVTLGDWTQFTFKIHPIATNSSAIIG